MLNYIRNLKYRFANIIAKLFKVSNIRMCGNFIILEILTTVKDNIAKKGEKMSLNKKIIYTTPYKTFEKLCKANKVTPYRVAQDTDISTATLSSWKGGDYEPKLAKLAALAEYFQVPIDHFIERKEVRR